MGGHRADLGATDIFKSVLGARHRFLTGSTLPTAARAQIRRCAWGSLLAEPASPPGKKGAPGIWSAASPTTGDTPALASLVPHPWSARGGGSQNDHARLSFAVFCQGAVRFRSSISGLSFSSVPRYLMCHVT